MNTGKYLSLMLIGLCTAALMSCGGSGGSDEGTGQLSLSLADAPNPEYQAVYVSVSEIQVHRAGDEEGSWRTVLTPGATYNLLDLINGRTADLGVTTLTTGTYTQMRLILAQEPDETSNILGDPHPYANYVVTPGNESIELKVPSGYQSGIKLVHPFEIESGRTVGLVLDFDAVRSVVQAGGSGQWLLKPTIKVIGVVSNATLAGTVTDEAENPVPGALVSAQTYDAQNDEIVVSTTTLTDSEGGYWMCLEPGTYTIVVTKEGFSASYTQVVTAADTDYTEDFALSAAEMGLVAITFTLPAGDSEEAASVEFRLSTPEHGMIAVKVASYAASGSYEVSLPIGTYSLKASCAGLTVTETAATGDAIGIDFTAPDA